MQATIFTIVSPIITLLIWKSYNREKEAGIKEFVIRYMVYLLLLLAGVSVLSMFFMEEGISFLQKADISTRFLLKYMILTAATSAVIGLLEWIITKRKIKIQIDFEGYKNAEVISVFRQFVCPAAIYILAAVMVFLNVSLMFDNVVWGDEAFSANTAKNTMGGIMEILYYWDSHPPLYYYWLKLFGDIFGHTVPIYHLASLVPFVIGIVLAVTVFKKHFGTFPAAFFIVISGLGSACLTYNLEIRMYALAFLSVTVCFYCAYRVLSTGRLLSWIGLVLWALIGAYTHYYALVSAGLLLFFTGVAVWMKQKGKSWLKGLLAVLIFIAGYSPWMVILYNSIQKVSSDWWMTDVLGLQESLNMVMGGNGMSKIVLAVIVGCAVILLAVESSLIDGKIKADTWQLQINVPSIHNWSAKTYTVIVGICAIAGTLIFGYGVSYLVKPLLAARYLYPVSAISICVLMVGISEVLELLSVGEKHWRIKGLYRMGQCLLLVLLAVLLVIGMNNYKTHSATVNIEKVKTEDVLNLIGEPQTDTQMVVNGVKHLGWTVLYHYYPDNEVVSDVCTNVDADKFWYFSGAYLSQEEADILQQKGYQIYGYGEMQISQYPLVLYYFEKQ